VRVRKWDTNTDALVRLLRQQSWTTSLAVDARTGPISTSARAEEAGVAFQKVINPARRCFTLRCRVNAPLPKGAPSRQRGQNEGPPS
jgi:hypothetical protein